MNFQTTQCRYSTPITHQGMSYLALKEFFKEQEQNPELQKILSSIGSNNVPDIFGEKVETIVPLLLPTRNIKKIKYTKKR